MEATIQASASSTAKKRIPVTRRERWAWYAYDFGNSAYAAVVLMAVYSSYFKNVVVGGSEGSRLWGLSISIAMLVVSFTTPILGVVADFSRSKKRFLNIYTGITIAFTAALYFVGAGNIFFGMGFFILAEIGYRSSQVFYNALLPEIAEKEEMGTISGNGWAIGSLGGIVALVIVLALIMFVKWEGVISFSFLITALFFLLSSLPLFLFVRERSEVRPLPSGETYFTVPFKQLARTFMEARKHREFLKFLIAFTIYNIGIIVTFDFAAIIGSVLFGFQQQGLILLMMIVSVTSVGGAYVFGKFADRLGGKTSLVVSLLAMTAIVIALVGVNSRVMFYVIAAFAGFALTGVQSVSRMMVGMLAPHDQTAEFYGLFAVASSISAFIGPAAFGAMAHWGANIFLKRGLEMIPAEQAGMRFAIVSIILFLLIGLGLLLFVKNRAGRNAAE